MKSKASYFSLSLPLIKENIRRFWAISVVGFLVYFLSGVFPILMSYGSINSVAGYIELTLNNIQPFYVAVNLLMPIITAVIIFKYVQNSSAVTAMHSMPLTRAKLYNSNLLSGLILNLVPVILNGIILLALAKPAYQEWMMYATTDKEDVVNLFARSEVLLWIWQTIVIILVVYAISVFAGIVTGNSIMHITAALGFNFLVPGLYTVFVAYCSEFLYGFANNSSWMEKAVSITPFLETFDCDGAFSTGLTAYYIINALVLIVISSILYHKRKMERASESLVFGFMVPIISYIIAFFGMTLLGFYFKEFADAGQENLYMFAGLAAGTLIFFIIGRMIVKKTPRIFDMKTLKSLVVYSVIAVVFVVVLVCDLTGFETRVPDASKIEGVSVSSFVTNDYTDRFVAASYGDDEKFIELCGNMGFYYTEPENIEAARQFQMLAIENKRNETDSLMRMSLDMSYNLGSKFSMDRSYSLDYSVATESQAAKQLFESKEFKDYFSLNNFKMKNLKNAYISNALFPEATSPIIDNKEEMKELWACLEKDFQERTYEEQISLNHLYGEMQLEYVPETGRSTSTLSLMVKTSDRNTIEWLRQHGYAESLEITADMVERIEFYKYDEMTKEERYAQESYMGKDMQYMVEEEDVVESITDKAQIQQILDSYKSETVNQNSYYWGSVTLTADAYYMITGGVAYDVGSSYGVYFDNEDVPNFVADLFEK